MKISNHLFIIFKTQEEIAETIRNDKIVWKDIDQSTVSRIIDDFMQNSDFAKMHKQRVEKQLQTLKQGDKAPVLSKIDKTEKHDTRKQVAKELNITHQTVSDIIGKFSSGRKNTKEFKPFLYNIWNTPKGNETDHFFVALINFPCF